MKDFGKTSDLFNIPVADITVDHEFNLRLDTPELHDHIEWLRGQIMNFGFLRSKPLIVRLTPEKQIVLVDGHCRLAAVRLCNAEGLGIETLPCLPEGKGVSAVDRTVMMFQANTLLNFSPLEQALGVKRLISYGLTEQQVGHRIGRTRQHVANLLELAAAPENVRVMVVEGVVSATEAVKTIRRDGEAAGATLRRAHDAAKADGKDRITARYIPEGKTGKPVKPIVIAPPAPAVPRVLQMVRVPLSTAAQHVVEMAKGVDLPDPLRRAIDALHESLT
jgi:ParB family chromosome partitioning protein